MIIHEPRVTPRNDDALLSPCIGTLSGELISIKNPQVDRIHLEDIAAGLANTCRWGGQIAVRYSVAQHVIACALVSKELRQSAASQLELLHHDDSEAYLCDIPRPLKQSLPDYGEVEQLFNRAIAVRFGLWYPWRNETVHQIDYAMLLAEAELFDRPRHWFPEKDFASPLVALCRVVVARGLEMTRTVTRTANEIQVQFMQFHQRLELEMQGVKST